MRRLRILVDMDDTVVNLLPAWLESWHRLLVSETYDPIHHVTVEEIKSYNTIEWIPDRRVLDNWLKGAEETGLLDIDGALDGLTALALDHDLFFMSVVYDAHAAAEKIAWIEEHAPFMAGRTYIGYAKQAKDKASWVNKSLFPADVMIDDAAHHIKQYREAHPKTFITGLAYPHTIHGGGLEHADVMFDWRDPVAGWNGIVTAINAFAIRGR